MGVEGTRRVMETTSQDTANQYLRFGWKLINQYVIPATPDSPSKVTYVLASIRSLEDTRQIVTLTDHDAVNRYLELGWRMIDKYLISSPDPDRRHEVLHYVLAWQTTDEPSYPRSEAEAVARESGDDFPDEIEVGP